MASATLERIRDDMKSAMRAGEKFRLGVIRMILAAVKQREVDERAAPDEAAVQALLEKMIKQRRDSVDQFRAGGRDDLADKEAGEIEILEGYLPQALSDAEVAALVEEAISAAGASSGKDMGRVMGEVKARAAGRRLDMAAASALVKQRLSAGN